MNIYQPTYLYIKEHSVTGLKYFGKTTKNPNSYHGSGKYWKSHIKIHGVTFVTTKWVKLFTSYDEITEFATAFSEIFDIVNSNQWANLCPENGINGGYRPNNFLIHFNKLPKTDHIRSAISKSRKGVSNFSKPVTINGITYPSLIAASKQLNVVEETIYNWVKTGKAKLI